ncbi:hypothetical protein WG947_11175 [Pontibacter sp. H259]|uniref:hypothetical protein n=1 Tax=Pontibacter sp. H259 TaxID=3133421 RepID=UPI0030C62A54
MFSTSINSTTPESASEKIASNTCYELMVDRAKNRIYFSILGYWKNKDVVPAFLEDWKKAVALTQPGFTVLTDMRLMITHPQELHELHLAAQKFVMEAGVKHVANVLPVDKIANLQANSISSTIKFPSQNFNTCEEAETWLNQLTITPVN